MSFLLMDMDAAIVLSLAPEGERQREILHDLIRAKGLRAGQYALFFVSGEGEFLPISSAEQPVEETSGFVIDHAGRIFSFWMHWDYDCWQPTLDWEQVDAESEWSHSREYQAARRQVGL